MKRLACLFLTAALVLALAAGGGPKLDPNPLSEAQAYAKAAWPEATWSGALR